MEQRTVEGGAMTDHETAGGMTAEELADIRGLWEAGAVLSDDLLRRVFEHIEVQAAELSRVTGELGETRVELAKVEAVSAERKEVIVWYEGILAELRKAGRLVP